MKAVFVLFCLFGVLAHADTSDTIRSALKQSGALNGVSESNGCRDYILDLVSGCSAELFPDYSIFDFLRRVLRVDGGEFKIRNDVLKKALKKFETDPKASLSVEGCCGAACKVAKNRCLCDSGTYSALKDLLGTETVELLRQFRDTCLADNSGLKFDMTIFGVKGCRKKKAAKKFICRA